MQFQTLRAELEPHMLKEERILFPYIMRLETAVGQKQPAPFAPFGEVSKFQGSKQSDRPGIQTSTGAPRAGSLLLLTLLIIVGSRKLEHYDAALFGYTVASVVALGAVVFRYAIWLQRPATRVYWRRGWSLYLPRPCGLARGRRGVTSLVVV